MSSYLRNFVRLTGVIDRVETETRRDLLLLAAENGIVAWISVDFQKHPELEPRRELWQSGMSIVALGTLESDGAQLFVSAFGLYSVAEYEAESKKRTQRRKSNELRFRTTTIDSAVMGSSR